jgi:hypothetical protein
MQDDRARTLFHTRVWLRVDWSIVVDVDFLVLTRSCLLRKPTTTHLPRHCQTKEIAATQRLPSSSLQYNYLHSRQYHGYHSGVTTADTQHRLTPKALIVTMYCSTACLAPTTSPSHETSRMDAQETGDRASLNACECPAKDLKENAQQQERDNCHELRVRW